jgi:DNA-directed RNA polymerase specialized sigma24 family protein
MLRCFEKLSYEDIARILGVSEGAVRKRMEYALNKLREAYRKK